MASIKPRVKLVEVKPDVHEQIKSFAVSNGMILKSVVNKAIVEYLERQNAIAG